MYESSNSVDSREGAYDTTKYTIVRNEMIKTIDITNPELLNDFITE
jgi:ribosomal protein S18